GAPHSGHAPLALAHGWSPHMVRSVGDKATLTTPPNVTEVVLRIREMLHAHARWGNRTAINRITYNVKIREQGETQWLQILGPFTKSRTAKSSLLSGSFSYTHRLVSHAFTNLPPATYEVQVEVLNKQYVGQDNGNNGNGSTYL